MLNNDLDRSALAEVFRSRKRIVIRDVLAPSAADMIHQCLIQDVPWGLAYQDENGPKSLDARELAALGPQALQALKTSCGTRAQRGFQFLYSCYPMLDAYLAKRDPQLLLHPIFEFINSGPMLDFVREVTGFPQIVRADAQATLFGPEHFLTLHNDFDPQKGRLVAYVMGFTKNWRPDYGGMLQFYNDRFDVDEGFLPVFNSLMMFSVPQLHAVTYVPPYAPVGRYAITGWFMDATAVPETTKARYGL